MLTSSLYAQEKKETPKSHLIFSENKILNKSEKVVYFCFSEIRDNDHKNQITKALLNEFFITKVRIYKDLNNNDRCQITTLRDITPEDIQVILKENETNFAFLTVKTKDNEESNKVNFLK